MIGGSRAAGRAVGPQAAEDLVGGDLDEAEGLGLGRGQRAPIGPHRFQQMKAAQQIVLDEGRRGIDGAVHMGLGGQMQHGGRAMLRQQGVHGLTIADIGLNEAVTRRPAGLGDRRRRAGIGQPVHIDHAPAGRGHQPADHRRADEAGPAGHQDAAPLAAHSQPSARRSR